MFLLSFLLSWPLWHWEQNIKLLFQFNLFAFPAVEMNSLVLWKVVFLLLGLSGVGSDEVSVMEGDSVTLHTGVTTNQQEDIRWYFNDTRIALITGDLSKICTDVQCNEGTERFRDRLKLDHQTGSLTITNITNTHSGEYHLQIINSGYTRENIFSVSVHDRPATERDEVKEGESVTFDPCVINPSDSMMWYYNITRIAEITGDQSKICTDVQCKERFTDRLKLDHPTGSLTITHTRTTDSGDYKLEINSNSRFSIRRKCNLLTVIAVPGSGLSPGVIAGIVVAVVLLAVAAVIYYRKCPGRRKRSRMQLNGHQVEIGENSMNYTGKSPVTVGNGTSHNGNEKVAASNRRWAEGRFRVFGTICGDG